MMREELEDVLELFEGMPPEGRRHWRERALPSIDFESDAERAEFVAALDEREEPGEPRDLPPRSS
jgi:hypothetical protein